MKELNYLDITKTTEQGHIKVPSANGEYGAFTAGSALQVLSGNSLSDKVPYILRPSASGKGITEKDTLVGASMAWNQLVKARDSSTGSPTLSYTKINDYQLLLSGSRDAGTLRLSAASNIQFIAGHKYLAYHNDPTFPSTDFVLSNSVGQATNVTGMLGVVINATTTATGYYGVAIPSGVSFNNTISVNLIDLTLALGSSIADYIYTLESGTAGAGVAKLREWGFFDKPYYAYNAGGIESVNVSKHRMVGFNQWDEEWEQGHYSTTGVLNATSNAIHSKNFTPCFPSTDYYCYLGKTGAQTFLCWYDNGQNFISRSAYINNGKRTSPANAAYFKMTTDTNYGAVYLNDICISIDKGTNVGKYEPYTVYEYPLPTDDLRGVYKLDANNNLYAYGDVRYPNGKTDRKYGIVKGNLRSWTKTADGIFTTNSIPRSYGSGVFNVICGRYASYTGANSTGSNIASLVSANGNAIYMNGGSRSIYVADSAYTDATAFTNSLADVDFVYELATPTEETADAFTSPQIVSPYGTEEYVDAGVEAGTRDVAVPVGHETEYPQPVAMLPDAPSSNGNYKLRCTVSGGVPTYSWVSE